MASNYRPLALRADTPLRIDSPRVRMRISSVGAIKGGNDEAYYSRCFNYLFVCRYRSGAVLRKPRDEQRRQAASWRCQKQLREEMQEGCLREQGSEQRGQAALRRGQKQLPGEMQEGCLDKQALLAISRRPIPARQQRRYCFVYPKSAVPAILQYRPVNASSSRELSFHVRRGHDVPARAPKRRSQVSYSNRSNSPWIFPRVITQRTRTTQSMSARTPGGNAALTLSWCRKFIRRLASNWRGSGCCCVASILA